MATERVVYKYPLELKIGRQVLAMPADARILHVQEQHERPTMWAEVSPGAVGRRTFAIFATGEPIDDAFTEYIGTVHIAWTVWHIYEAR